MFIQKLVPVLLATMATLPSALAGSCKVRADVNESQGGAIQDVTVTTGDGSELIFDKSDGICGPATFWTGDDGDLKGDATLASPIAWDASCNLGAITSCSADYQDQKGLKGTLSDKLGQNYHSCTVEFDC